MKERRSRRDDAGARGSGKQGTVRALELSTIARNIIQRIKGARVRNQIDQAPFIYRVFRLTVSFKISLVWK